MAPSQGQLEQQLSVLSPESKSATIKSLFGSLSMQEKIKLANELLHTAALDVLGSPTEGVSLPTQPFAIRPREDLLAVTS